MPNYGLLIRPLLTEKISRINTKSGNTEYVFVVDSNANKIEIRREIEKMYNVNIESIRTVIVAPKTKRRYTKTGILSGKTKSYKKAYIRIQQGEEINIYEG